VRHGLSKALMRYEPELRGVLKRAGFLTRDPRVVERKKYGPAKAPRWRALTAQTGSIIRWAAIAARAVWCGKSGIFRQELVTPYGLIRPRIE
jgi:hypothetical protein